MTTTSNDHHSDERYYVPHGSHWPVVGSVGLLFLMVGVSSWLNGADAGFYFMLAGFGIVIFMMTGWFSEVIRESTGGMYNAPVGIRGLNTTDPKRYNGKASYAYAKRAQAVLTEYWDRKYRGQGIRSYVTHPGWAKTPGVKDALPMFWKIQNLILRTPLQGGDTALWLCATRPAALDEEAVWFDRKARPVHMYEFTKKAQCTEQELVDYLQQELDSMQETPETA